MAASTSSLTQRRGLITDYKMLMKMHTIIVKQGAVTV